DLLRHALHEIGKERVKRSFQCQDEPNRRGDPGHCAAAGTVGRSAGSPAGAAAAGAFPPMEPVAGAEGASAGSVPRSPCRKRRNSESGESTSVVLFGVSAPS